MKSLTYPVILFSLLTNTLFGASWVVSPGQSLQSAIDAAVAGDNITVQSGGYDENITITKGLDIRGVGVVSVTGTLSITDTALPVYIADINFGKEGATSMTLSGADQDVRMDRCSLALQGDFSMTGGEFYGYKNTFTNNVTFDAADWTFQRTTVDGDLTVTGVSTSKFIASNAKNFSHTGGECTIFQSDVHIYTTVDVRPQSAKSWIAYSSLCFADVYGASEIVGNHFVLSGYDEMGYKYVSGNGVAANENPLVSLTNSGGQITMRNNVLEYLPIIILAAQSFAANRFTYNGVSQVWNYPTTSNFYFDSRYGIKLNSGAGLTQIFNNTLCSQGPERGIFIDNQPGACEVRNNTICVPETERFSSVSSFNFSSSYLTSIDDGVSFFNNDGNMLVTLQRFAADFALLIGDNRNINYVYPGLRERPSYIYPGTDLSTSVSADFYTKYSIQSNSSQSVITNNLVATSSINGGVQLNNATGSPIFESTDFDLPQPYFTTDAAIVDLGTADIIFNDIDGSLNDIGAYGGHSYDPTGRTTTNPVILSGAVSPLYVKRGGSVTVNARAAVVAEP